MQRGAGAHAVPAVWRAASLLVVLAMVACGKGPPNSSEYRSARAIAEYSFPEPVLEMMILGIAPGVRKLRRAVRRKDRVSDQEMDGMLADLRRHALDDRQAFWHDLAERFVKIYSPEELKRLHRFHEAARTTFLKVALADITKSMGERKMVRLLTERRDRFPDMPLLMAWLKGGGSRNTQAFGYLSEAEKKELERFDLRPGTGEFLRKQKQADEAFGVWANRAGRKAFYQ